jgi:hypothetical protein
MPRGYKIDRSATATALFTGALRDKRSFISLPKHTHGDEAVPHLILYGKDKGPVRAEIFRRNREANGGINVCWKCHCVVLENEESLCPISDWNPSIGHWHHLWDKPGQRCDCPEAGAVSCPACHRASHKQVMFSAHRK